MFNDLVVNILEVIDFGRVLLFCVVLGSQENVADQCGVWSHSKTHEEVITRWDASHFLDCEFLSILSCETFEKMNKAPD
jgi:hypothetical protein